VVRLTFRFRSYTWTFSPLLKYVVAMASQTPLVVGNLIKFQIKSGVRELITQPLTIVFSALHLLYVGSVSISCLISSVINPSLSLPEINISMICDHSS